MTGWADWRPHARAFRSPHVDWEVAFYETLGRLAEMTMIPVPPVLVNLSFGKQAGAPDPWRAPEVQDGTPAGDAPVAVRPGADRPAVLVAAGNDTLERCHALFELGDDDRDLAWRVQPDDETSDFLEFRALPECRPGLDRGVPDAPLPLHIDLERPDGARAGFATPDTATVRELQRGLGRISCDWVFSDHRGGYRLRYLVCLAPDGLAIEGDPESRGPPAGQYRTHLRNTSGTTALKVRARIQTDEATLPSARNARRAYFEDPA